MAQNRSLPLGPIPSVPFAEIIGNPPSKPTIASLAEWLKIDREVRHRIHRKPKFFLVEFRANKFENGVLVESGIGCLTDPSKADSCGHNWFWNTEGHLVRWKVEGYCIDPPDLPKLIAVCDAHSLHFAGVYDKPTKLPIGYDDREESVRLWPRLDNETETQMTEQLKEVFFGPPPRYNPEILNGHRVVLKTEGALDDKANFWAIQVEPWPTQRKYHKDDFEPYILFENNWICTTNRMEVEKWFRNGRCRGEGAAEIEFKTGEECLGFLKECEPLFGKLKVMKTFNNNEQGGPIEGIAVYSENFEETHNQLASNPMEYGYWESKGTEITLQDLERELEERSGVPKGKSRRG